MKKLTVLICLIAASITLGACSSSSQSAQSDEETTQQKLQEDADEEAAEAEEEAEEAEEAAQEADEAAQEADEAAQDAEDANQKAMMAKNCPGAVEGVKAEAKKGEGHMSLAMMASGENVAELQKRAKMMAERHNSMHGHAGKKAKKGKKGKGMMGKGKGMKKGHGVMGMATAEYEETDEGAMLHFTPAKSEHMTGLEKQVGEHAKWINEGKCPGREMAKDKKGKKGMKDAPAAE
ncbi:MAG: hypothetical protein ACQEVA_11290 [Myxococcota bacterium]